MNNCTIRYQYIKPSVNPIRGGNKSLIDLEELEKKKVDGTQMWLLQPIDRTKNIFGINLMVNRNDNFLVIECVGKGFDISDINRGDISPQESIYFNYPIEMGWQNEWWKFIKMNMVTIVVIASNNIGIILLSFSFLLFKLMLFKVYEAPIKRRIINIKPYLYGKYT